MRQMKWRELRGATVAFLTFACTGGAPRAQAAAPKCPGDVVGDPARRPTISIVGLRPGDSTVHGRAFNVDARKVHVVLWALTNVWYIQPSASSPLTPVCSDSSWKNTTHPWKRMVALLADSTYAPRETSSYHPAFERGVLAWTQVPPARPDLPIAFSGRRWGIKVAEDPVGPGPNVFSDSPQNVWVDTRGRLHLRITAQRGRWTSSEVYLLKSLGYGEYTIQLASRVDSLDPQAVFGFFTYESPTRESDVEFSRSALTAPGRNAQYVIQPWQQPGHRLTFRMPAAGMSTHRILWRPGRLEFLSWRGWGAYPPDARMVISSWHYSGKDVPPAGLERLHLNLWLFGGKPPVSGRGDEVIIASFRFRP
jgi:hypothetical protein